MRKIFIYLFCALIIIFNVKSVLKNTSVQVNELVSKNDIVNWEHARKTPGNIKTFIKAYNINYTLPKSISGDIFDSLDIDEIMSDVTHNYIIITIINFLYILCFILFLFTFVKALQCENHDKEGFKNYYLAAPLIFAAAPVLDIYTRNITDIKPENIIPIIFLITLFLALIFFVLKQITKNNFSAAALTSVISVVLHFYKDIAIISDGIIYTSLILMLCVLMNKINPKKLTEIFFYTSLILLLINVYQLTVSITKNIYFKTSYSHEIISENRVFDRDIYLIILDEYPNSDYLKKLSGFDNQEFLNELKKRNFFVNDKLRSAYGKTRYAVPSILNLNYIQNLSFNNKNSAVTKNTLQQLAKSLGYYNIYINNVSDFDVKQGDVIDKAYNIKNYIFVNNTISTALSNSLYYVIILPLNKIYISDNKLSWEKFKYAVNIPKKKFTILHIMSPHEPYLHDKEGTNITENNGLIKIGDIENRANIPMYIEYLIYTNNKTLEIADEILETSDKPPVIIIMGDHGIRYHSFIKNDIENCKILFSEKDFINSYFSTLMAYYNPEDNYEDYKNIETHINFMRQVSNNIFGTDYKPLTENLYYVYMDLEHAEIDFNTIDQSTVNVTHLLR